TLEVAEGGQGDARKAGRGSLLGAVAELAHLLDAPGEELAGAGIVPREVVAAAGQIHRRGGQVLVGEAIGDEEALLRIARGDPEGAPDVGEAPEPVQDPGQAHLVAEALGQPSRPLEVDAVLLERLPRAADAGALEADVNLGPEALRRAGERTGEGEGLVVVGSGLGVRIDAGGPVARAQGVLDRVVIVIAPGVV